MKCNNCGIEYSSEYFSKDKSICNECYKKNYRLSNPGKKWSKTIFFTLSAILFLSSSIYLYSYVNQPKKIAEEYLKATRLHDYEKIVKLSSIGLSGIVKSFL